MASKAAEVSGRRLRSSKAPWLFLSPFLLIFTVFLLYPIVRSIILSFQQTAGPGATHWVGLANYQFLIGDRLFWLACLNTIAFTVGFIVVQVPLSLGLALLLNRKDVRARSFFRFAFFATHLFGSVFIAVVFNVILGSRDGPINRVYGLLAPGEESIAFLSEPTLVLPILLVAALWISVGYGMIYLLAALQSVGRELYDAADVDGAGPVGRFLHVTLPGIRPVLVFLILIGTIGGLQLFEMPYVLYQGDGPGRRALTIVGYLFAIGFTVGDLGYASAVGWVLVLLIGFIAAAQIRLTGFGREATG